MQDKFTAVWVSHTSISDFLDCPRAYYLKHIYKDPKTGHKIKIMTPALALGSAVHDVLESLSVLPAADRFNTPLPQRLNQVWPKVSGKLGGFINEDTEHKYKEQAREMLARVWRHPGIINQPALKLKKELPYIWLSEEDNIILCGKIDWMEYLPDTNSVHIIDFKTGKSKNNQSTLQLPIYYVLVSEVQARDVTKASYWYLRHDDVPEIQELPDLEEARKQVLDIAKQIKLARQLKRFSCKNGDEGCYSCKPFEKIINGQGEFVGEDEYKHDTYILKREEESDEAVIL